MSRLPYLFLAFTLVAPAVGRAQALLPAEPQQGGIEAVRPWLGVAIERGEKGVRVKDVLAGTPAETAGIKGGDQILAVDAVTVKIPEELIAAVANAGVGNSVTVRWLRDAKEMHAKIKLVARPDQLEVLRKQLVGKPAPPFDLKVVHGSSSGKTEELKGKVVIVEFWATWCPACRSTHPRLSEFAKQHKGRVAIVAISDEDEATIKQYVKQTKPSFTILADPDHKTPGPWLVSAIPQLAVLDKTGTVTYATVGAGEYLEEALAEADRLAK